MDVRPVESITPGANVFNEDFEHQGVKVGNDEKAGERVLVMWSTNPHRYVIVVNEKTGERALISWGEK